MDFDLTVNKIVTSYMQQGIDLNESIAKYAEEHHCNIEQTKRLVEKANQETYLAKFAQDGTQTFDIADYNKVKNIVQTLDNEPIEKKASTMTKFEVNYSKENIYNSDEMEKTASEETYTLKNINEAVDFCTSKINEAMTKIASSYEINKRNYNFESIEKCAEENSNNELKIVEHYSKIKEVLLEKKAGLVSGVAGLGLRAGGHAVGFVAKAPMKRGLNPLMYSSAAVSGAKKAATETTPAVSNMAELPKTAGLLDEAGQILKASAPFMLAAGAIGVADVTARGMGGLISRMMDSKHLNESFNTVMSNNKDLKDIPNARAYYDVIARHAPDLANDPMVAPQLIRQFDAFGGVDVNTVGKLREIQNEGSRSNAQTPGMGDYVSMLQGAGKGTGLVSELAGKRIDVSKKRIEQKNYETTGKWKID